MSNPAPSSFIWPSFLLWVISCSSSSEPVESHCLIPTAFLKSLVLCFSLVTFPCAVVIHLPLAVLLGDALAWDAGRLLRKVCLSGGQIAINKLQYFFHETILNFQGSAGGDGILLLGLTDKAVTKLYAA